MMNRAVDIAQAVAEFRLTPAQICAEHLENIARTDSDIDAWVWHDPTAALSQAGRIDAGLPLSGVTVGLKDIIDSNDMPCCLGSALFAGRQPRIDAVLVQKLRAAGALIMGKTRTTEFAYLQRCETRNPHDSRFSPGGSSSGSAAAVGAGHVTLAIGSQTGGSVIRPAAYCGVYGFKPSFEAISRTGVLQTSQTLDHIGIFARHLVDIARLGDVVMTDNAGLETACQQSDTACPHFLWVEGMFANDIEGYMAERVSQLASLLGGHAEQFDLRAFLDELQQAHSVIYDYEYAQNIGPMIAGKQAGVSEFTSQTVARGNRLSEADYHSAMNIRQQGIKTFTDLLSGGKMLLLASATGQAPLFEEGTGNPACSKFTSLCGLPALTLPYLEGIDLRGPDGLPLGIQLVGAPANDDGVISAAGWLEAYCRHLAK
jgi:Asp-tRNA(Asn)/Glu-tRNA(Gln) amidotransferase A subunit family amidase